MVKPPPYEAALRRISALGVVTETPTYYTSQSCKTSAKQREAARLRNCRDTNGVEFKITRGVLRDEGQWGRVTRCDTGEGIQRIGVNADSG
jgi:hypothetical protein